MLDLAFYLKDYNLTANAMLVYGLLDGLSKASKKKGLPFVYIGQKAIAKHVGISPRTAWSCMKQLREAGLIYVVRRGLTRNNETYVLEPKMKQEEKKSVKAICDSRKVKRANHSKSSNKELNNTDISICPQNDKAPTAQTTNKGYTAPKGKPTNKRPQNNVIERKKLKKRIKDYLKEKVCYEDIRRDIFLPYEEVEAFDKIIELIANTAAGKGKVMTNGTLLTASEWWKEVMNISQNSIRNIIYKIEHFENVRNPRAYILAMLYNAALEEKISAPAFLL